MVQHQVMISTMEHKVGHSPIHTVLIGRRGSQVILHVVITAVQEVLCGPMLVRPMQLHLRPTLPDAPTSRSMHGCTKADLVVGKRLIQVRIFSSSTRLQVEHGRPSTPSKVVVHKPAISNIQPPCRRLHSIPHPSSESNKPLVVEHAVITGLLMM